MINLSIASILFDYCSNMFSDAVPIVFIRIAYGLNILATACLYSFTRFFPYKNEAKKNIVTIESVLPLTQLTASV